MAAINYVSAAAMMDPNVSFSSYADPTDYDSLVWNTTQIPEIDLENHWVMCEKKRIIDKLTDDMIVAVQAGFTSDVLVPGTFRKYDTSIQGQIGIIGAYIYSMKGIVHPTGRTFNLASYDLVYGLISVDQYTANQLSTLLDVFATFSEGLMQKLTDKIIQVLAINETNPHDSLDLIYAVTWN